MLRTQLVSPPCPSPFVSALTDNSLCSPDNGSMANKRRICYTVAMDEGRKRVIGIMAAILASLHMQTADDLFGGPQGSPRSDKLIAASVQWAEKIMEKIDNVFRSSDLP
jgi:hypothetical protein